jgi:serine/threonine protein kinase
MIVGSPSYIAPEVWKGRPEGLDQRVDVYSFGVAVFRALANRLPFEGATLQDKFRLTTTAPRPSLRALRPELSPDIDDWVAQVLAIEPEGRFNGIRSAWNALLQSIRTPERGGMWALSPSADLPPVDQWQPVEAVPAELPPEPPPPSLRQLRSTTAGGGAVLIAPVVAIARDPSQLADDKKSFVREWLAGTELAPSADPADVASWLGVEEVPSEPAEASDLVRPVRKAPKPPRKPKAKPKVEAKPNAKAKAKAKAKSKAKAKPARRKKRGGRKG